MKQRGGVSTARVVVVVLVVSVAVVPGHPADAAAARDTVSPGMLRLDGDVPIFVAAIAMTEETAAPILLPQKGAYQTLEPAKLVPPARPDMRVKKIVGFSLSGLSAATVVLAPVVAYALADKKPKEDSFAGSIGDALGGEVPASAHRSAFIATEIAVAPGIAGFGLLYHAYGMDASWDGATETESEAVVVSRGHYRAAMFSGIAAGGLLGGGVACLLASGVLFLGAPGVGPFLLIPAVYFGEMAVASGLLSAAYAILGAVTARSDGVGISRQVDVTTIPLNGGAGVGIGGRF
ncbi:MAG: hypothetical protein HY897_19510 [Deltaproteobacteria bacterium]|nr:hypothetical protein [Deltaproteobacteria bacterium]